MYATWNPFINLRSSGNLSQLWVKNLILSSIICLFWNTSSDACLDGPSLNKTLVIISLTRTPLSDLKHSSCLSTTQMWNLVPISSMQVNLGMIWGDSTILASKMHTKLSRNDAILGCNEILPCGETNSREWLKTSSVEPIFTPNVSPHSHWTLLAWIFILSRVKISAWNTQTPGPNKTSDVLISMTGGASSLLTQQNQFCVCCCQEEEGRGRIRSGLILKNRFLTDA